jgi:hypothetical protein
MKTVPQHHKDIFRHLRALLPGPDNVFTFADNQNKCLVPVGYYGPARKRFYATIGISDRKLPIPAGRFELAAFGKTAWLPNALASSVYWLKGRRIKEWPLVCEDVVKHNTRSTYRHMAYVPSEYTFTPPGKRKIRWLLGVPITDAEIGLGYGEVLAKVKKLYPKWMTTTEA